MPTPPARPQLRVAPSILSADFGSLSEAVDSVAPGDRLAPCRCHGRALRPQSHHRAAGGGLPAGAHRPVLRHPPDDHRPRQLPRGVPRRRLGRVHRPCRGGPHHPAHRPDAGAGPAGRPGRQSRHAVRGARALPRPGRPGAVHDRLPRFRGPVLHRRRHAQGARRSVRRPSSGASPSTWRSTGESTRTPWSRRPGRGPMCSWPARRCSVGPSPWPPRRTSCAPRPPLWRASRPDPSGRPGGHRRAERRRVDGPRRGRGRIGPGTHLAQSMGGCRRGPGFVTGRVVGLRGSHRTTGGSPRRGLRPAGCRRCRPREPPSTSPSSRARTTAGPRPAPRPSWPPGSGGWWWHWPIPTPGSTGPASPPCARPASRSRWGWGRATRGRSWRRT